MNIAFLKQCDEAYYNTGKLLLSDNDYDSLKEHLRAEFPTNPYFQIVGVVPAGSSVVLPYILGSLNKTKPDGSLLKWCKDNNIEELILSDKLDGVSIYTKYQNGQLVQATTRGNGREGKDITEKVKLIVPTCKGNGIREFRGEAVMTQNDCDRLGYSLPRSAVAGILNGDDKEHFDKCEFIKIIFYNALGADLTRYAQHYREIENADLEWPVFVKVRVSDELEVKMIEYYHLRKNDNRYDIDGIVVASVDDPMVGEDYYPSNMVAFKVNEKPVTCSVTSVEWEVKRSGKLQPVVNFKPVNIGGSMVSKATGFNAKFIRDKHITNGSDIGIVKSGDIIPYIVDVYTGFDGAIAPIPTNCPACGDFLDSSPSGVDMICTSPVCEGKMVYKIEHFLLAHGVEEVTAKTIKKLKISGIPELYYLSHGDISYIEGLGSYKATTIIDQLKKTLDTTPENLLKSFGIPGIGRTASAMIINKFGDFDKLFLQDQSDFMKIDGVGEVLARNLVNGLIDNVTLYLFLKKQGLKFEEKASMDLQGKIFCLTGKSDIARNDLMQMIGSHGGMVKGISKKVDFVVTNDVNSTSGKMKKAIQYGIPVIDYDELLNIIS